MFYQLVIVTCFVTLSACASQHTSYEMGSATRQIVQSQTFDKEAANNPPKGVVAGMDGGAAEQVIRSYRKAGKQQGSAEQATFSMKGK